MYCFATTKICLESWRRKLYQLCLLGKNPKDLCLLHVDLGDQISIFLLTVLTKSRHLGHSNVLNHLFDSFLFYRIIDTIICKQLAKIKQLRLVTSLVKYIQQDCFLAAITETSCFWIRQIHLSRKMTELLTRIFNEMLFLAYKNIRREKFMF